MATLEKGVCITGATCRDKPTQAEPEPNGGNNPTQAGGEPNVESEDSIMPVLFVP